MHLWPKATGTLCGIPSINQINPNQFQTLNELNQSPSFTYQQSEQQPRVFRCKSQYPTFRLYMHRTTQACWSGLVLLSAMSDFTCTAQPDQSIQLSSLPTILVNPSLLLQLQRTVIKSVIYHNYRNLNPHNSIYKIISISIN